MNPRLDTIKTVALAIAIIVVLNLFINIGVRTFYPAPDFSNFCGEAENIQHTSQNSCEDAGGKWITAQNINGEFSRPAPKMVGANFNEYCDSGFMCRGEYSDADELYSRNVFIILLLAGLVSLGVGYGITAVEAVSSGFVFGGVLSFIIGTMRYWSGMDEYLRFIVLGLVLIILVWIGYRRLRK